MPYLYDLFFVFSLTFIVTNHVTLFKQMYLFFVHFLEYRVLFFDDNVVEESEKFSNRESLVSGCCLAFAWFFTNLSLALLIKKRIYCEFGRYQLLEWVLEKLQSLMIFYLYLSYIYFIYIYLLLFYLSRYTYWIGNGLVYKKPSSRDSISIFLLLMPWLVRAFKFYFLNFFVKRYI